MSVLSKKEILDGLSSLEHWSYVPEGIGKISKKFQFQNFKEAFAFMTFIALHAESINHHPEWTNVYNQVTIALNSHDARGVTKADVDLATEIDRIAALFKV